MASKKKDSDADPVAALTARVERLAAALDQAKGAAAGSAKERALRKRLKRAQRKRRARMPAAQEGKAAG